MIALARIWSSGVLLGINLALFVALGSLFVFRGAMFSPPWDGPAVVTIALTVATIVLAAVGVGVALLAIWGYTALREHAERTAEAAADRAADRKVGQLLREWGLSNAEDSGSGEEVAQAYGQEK